MYNGAFLKSLSKVLFAQKTDVLSPQALKLTYFALLWP